MNDIIHAIERLSSGLNSHTNSISIIGTSLLKLTDALKFATDTLLRQQEELLSLKQRVAELEKQK